MSTLDEEPLVAQIPADVDQPDKLLYGLTARQLVILVITALLALWFYFTAAPWLPLAVIVAVLLPVVAAGAVLAVGRRDGLSLDRFVVTALAHLRAPKTRIATSGDIAAPPGWCRMEGSLPAPLRLPVRAVREDGVMELTEGGTAVMVRAGTVAFALRTASEQAALVAVFGRWLNSLDAPTQILVRARAADLSGLVDRVQDAAPGLPDSALEEAALDHAAFLAELTDSRELLVREVLVVLRDHGPQAPSRPWTSGRRQRALRDAGATVVLRRAEEAARALGVLGISTEVLDAAACTQVLAEALSPAEPPLVGAAGPGEVITARTDDLIGASKEIL
ncbi:PrgI family protein [Spirillospora sp. NPDC048911]|uniref:PrgI family protein n=1 Tax=Spirillospora sp. NPDC048911 TaxID=3364527 RepID=UPI0037206BD6